MGPAPSAPGPSVDPRARGPHNSYAEHEPRLLYYQAKPYNAYLAQSSMSGGVFPDTVQLGYSAASRLLLPPFIGCIVENVRKPATWLGKPSFCALAPTPLGTLSLFLFSSTASTSCKPLPRLAEHLRDLDDAEGAQSAPHTVGECILPLHATGPAHPHLSGLELLAHLLPRLHRRLPREGPRGRGAHQPRQRGATTASSRRPLADEGVLLIHGVEISHHVRRLHRLLAPTWTT